MKQEEEIQNKVMEFLKGLEIPPFSVIFTHVLGKGILSITFWYSFEIKEFLDKIDYRSLCDKTGFQVLWETNTVLISDLALLRLFTKINEDGI